MFRRTIIGNVILLTVLCTGSTRAWAQDIPKLPTGFYIILDLKNCSHPVPSLNKKERWCLSERPYILKSEFQSISDVMLDPKYLEKYIELQLTPSGFNKWKTLIKSLPLSKLALVINEKVAGTFINNGETPHSIIPLRGPINSSEVDWIHDQLVPETQVSENKE